GELGSAGQERELAARMAEAIAAEYRALIEQAAVARRQAAGQRRRTAARLRRESRRIRARDYFPPPERELAQRALDELVALVEELRRGLSMVRDDAELLALAGPLCDGLYEYRKRALLTGREPA